MSTFKTSTQPDAPPPSPIPVEPQQLPLKPLRSYFGEPSRVEDREKMKAAYAALEQQQLNFGFAFGTPEPEPKAKSKSEMKEKRRVERMQKQHK